MLPLVSLPSVNTTTFPVFPSGINETARFTPLSISVAVESTTVLMPLNTFLLVTN